MNNVVHVGFRLVVERKGSPLDSFGYSGKQWLATSGRDGATILPCGKDCFSPSVGFMADAAGLAAEAAVARAITAITETFILA